MLGKTIALKDIYTTAFLKQDDAFVSVVLERYGMNTTFSFLSTGKGKRSLGEADYKDKVLVRPTKLADDQACFWVRIQKGSHEKGQGVIITPTKTPTLEVGDSVEYAGGSPKKRPLFKRKMRKRNCTEQLKKEMCRDLAAAMTGNTLARPQTPLKPQRRFKGSY